MSEVTVNANGYDEIPVVNPDDYRYYDSLYVIWMGAYGEIKVYVWARCFEDALEEAAEYAGKHKRGVFTDPDYRDAVRDYYRAETGADYDAARAVYPDGCTIEPWPDYPYDDDTFQEEVSTRAETDMTYTESGWIASWEWGGAEITDADEYERVKLASRGGAVRWRLYTYDVWGNDEDGFEVNDVYRQSTVLEIPADADEDEIMDMMEAEDGPLVKGTCEIPRCFDTEDVIYFERKDNGKPVCEIRKEAAE